MALQYIPGALVFVRGRQWIVTESDPPLLTLRPLAGGAETVIHTEVEDDLASAEFRRPDIDKDIGSYAGARLLSDAVRLKLKDAAGAFRSLGRLAFEPRHYQYVPLLLALQHNTVRLLIADDVGIGKTIEAGMIAAELLARSDISRLAVLCPPHLCDQWQKELHDKFNIEAQTVTAAIAPRLERSVPQGTTLFHHHPYTVTSLDFIKSDSRRDEFARDCPEFVIIDEAHTRIWRGGRNQQGYRLLNQLAQNQDRHMVFLTATPHSGDDSAFFNLLALLHEDFKQLETAADNRRRSLRERLGGHFVQRMRTDIEKTGYQNSPFPQRDSQEINYTADNTPYGDLLSDILAACRNRVEQPQASRMTYWSMLALMRCVSSSPRAAQAALNNRIKNHQDTAAADHNEEAEKEASEEEIKRHIMDGEEEDAGSSDLPPPIDEPAAQQAELIELAQRAEQIANSGNDPKLAALRNELASLLKAGKTPIIFCRYIATAEYIKQHLKKHYEKYTIEAITGELPPSARLQQVEELGKAPRRILVATDCLSEGINLQAYFDSVIHYDLSWNPTRHQQREGRVDRLGQNSKTVSTRMLYGRDNPVDGAVLQVIIRKAEHIRRELGVYVPLPDDDESMTEALLKAVLLRSKQPSQMQLFQLTETREINKAWEKAETQIRGKRKTLFAQSRIKPEHIIPETTDIVKTLGDAVTARRFVCAALRARGITVIEPAQTDGGITVEYSADQHPDLAAWLPDGKSIIDFTFPAAASALHLHRAHPLVRHLAETIFESALLPEPEYAHRAGAYYSRAVQQVTTIAVIRMRHQLHTAKKHIQLAEESAVLRIDGVSNPTIREDESVLKLLDAPPAANISEGRRKEAVERALQRLDDLQEKINQFAGDKAQKLKEAHERVRRSAAKKTNITAIEKSQTALPPDIIGVYVVLPYGESGE